MIKLDVQVHNYWPNAFFIPHLWNMQAIALNYYYYYLFLSMPSPPDWVKNSATEQLLWPLALCTGTSLNGLCHTISR